MTALTNNQQQVMETLAGQFNSEYPNEYAHRDDVTTKFYLIFDLQDLGLIEKLEDDHMFIRLTQAGREYMGLTVAEVVSEVEVDSYVVKTSMREVKFSKKTMKATGKFAGWRLALIKPKAEATQPPTVKTQRVNPDLFAAYQKAVTEFEAANEVYHEAEAEWLKTGQWPDDKRDAGKVRESALDAKKVASNNYYNLN